MPNRQFLEEYPLYRRYKMSFRYPLRYQTIFDSSSLTEDTLEYPSIHMHCSVCASEQTFTMDGDYYTAFAQGMQFSSPMRAARPIPVTTPVAFIIYRCTSCERFLRYFAVKFDSDNEYVMKVGQEPPWEIIMDPTLKKTLAARDHYFKKGLVCESQGYGIGAFGYYRRIVEEIIDELLEGIPDLMSGEERDQYLEALEKAKRTTVTQDKIDLVKDLLPPILRPDGMNPLYALHNTLSEGLHNESDERCLELAVEVRETLVFLVNQIEVTKSSSTRFTESMRRLLDRRHR
jgi:hypothetical protein